MWYWYHIEISSCWTCCCQTLVLVTVVQLIARAANICMYCALHRICDGALENGRCLLKWLNFVVPLMSALNYEGKITYCIRVPACYSVKALRITGLVLLWLCFYKFLLDIPHAFKCLCHGQKATLKWLSLSDQRTKFICSDLTFHDNAFLS